MVVFCFLPLWTNLHHPPHLPHHPPHHPSCPCHPRRPPCPPTTHRHRRPHRCRGPHRHCHPPPPCPCSHPRRPSPRPRHPHPTTTPCFLRPPSRPRPPTSHIHPQRSSPRPHPPTTSRPRHPTASCPRPCTPTQKNQNTIKVKITLDSTQKPRLRQPSRIVRIQIHICPYGSGRPFLMRIHADLDPQHWNLKGACKRFSISIISAKFFVPSH